MRAIVVYQRAVDGRPSPCRFTPSCSSYALEALQVHGTWRGLALTLRRFVRCRPFGPSGWDPVPEASPRHADGQPRATTPSHASGGSNRRSHTTRRAEAR